MKIFSKLFGSKPSQAAAPQSTSLAASPAAATTTIETSAANPFRIKQPAIGFFCASPSFSELMEADKAALGPLFSKSFVLTNGSPACDVLMIYCDVEANGKLTNLRVSLRELIKSAGALIAIVATNNPPEHYSNSIGGSNGWTANIVLVADRNGDKFQTFFKKLFQAMNGGTSMMMAWVKLAPQGPGGDLSEYPTTCVLAEAGHLTFDG